MGVLAEHLSNADVGEFDGAVAAHHDVFRIDGMMDDILFEQSLQRFREGQCHLEGFARRQRMRLHEFGERTTFHIFHDDVGEIFFAVKDGVFYLDDVCMMDTGCKFHVLQALRHKSRLFFHKGRFQQFDGEGGVHDRLLDEIHFTDMVCP